MGLYYSLTFDVYHDRYPHRPYVEYAHNQVKELVELYAPDLLWSDDYWKSSEKSAASTWNSEELIAYFYNHAADPSQVLVNDRWGKVSLDRLLGDYATPEYAAITASPPFYWEATRGIGHSYGYNRAETEEHYLSVGGLIRLLADVVSKNGNLLLNVGPTAEGTIPPIQEERLRGLGTWLATDGEAIFDTRPWICAEGTTARGEDVRFTMKEGTVYAIVLAERGQDVTIQRLVVPHGSSVRLLGVDDQLEWQQGDDGLQVSLPHAAPEPHAYCLQITPQPWLLMQHTGEPPVAASGPTWRQCGSLYVP
jgi:alpha-L-fucosidase